MKPRLLGAMASNIVHLAVTGVTESNFTEWKAHIDTFLNRERAAASLACLRRFFGHESHPGLLASITILKCMFGKSHKFSHKKSVIENAQHAAKTAKTIYRKLKDHAHESSMLEIFQDCKTRMILILDNTCNCVDCTRLIQILKGAPAMMRPPNLNPHKKYSDAATSLTWIYNQVVLNLDVALVDEEVTKMFLKPEEFNYFGDTATETAMVATCLNFCWLFFMLEFYILSELRLLQNQMEKTCSMLGISGNDHVNVCKYLFSLETHNYKTHEVDFTLANLDLFEETQKDLNKKYKLTPQSEAKICEISGVSRRSRQYIEQKLSKFIRPRHGQGQEVSCLENKLGNLSLERTETNSGRASTSCDIFMETPSDSFLKNVVTPMDIIQSSTYGQQELSCDNKLELTFHGEVSLEDEEIELEISDEEIELEISDEEADLDISDEDLDISDEEADLDISDEEAELDISEEDKNNDSDDDENKSGEASGISQHGQKTTRSKTQEDDSSEDEDDLPFYEMHEFERMLYSDRPTAQRQTEKQSKEEKLKSEGYFRV
ncbi:tegument protein G48 [Vespertilionid gammaherpesvirus 1]|uniref:Tegument protein G48 n=1 Tax=Vespertilionid gammaherpesvirus 1 TaxID=2560830 RepID=A0A0X9YMK3_9GAMA|nr:tegument protein G48 [Myotis gammaherpesvirus 8]AMA67403.1 tegument protein G48 [Vespertilionid gammaherpesvirus 1]